MEAPEVPLEQVQEHVEHHAHETHDTFVSRVALSTAILAAFAAVVSLLAGDHANEAMICQMQASDGWAFFQAKSIKSAVLKAKGGLLEAQGQKLKDADEKKLAEYEQEQKDLEEKAKEKQEEAELHLHKHKLLAPGVTMFQIAIAIGAISALTRRKAFWGVSVLFGLIGIGFLVWELVETRPHEPGPAHHAAWRGKNRWITTAGAPIQEGLILRG